MSKITKELLTPADFAECPVWRYDPDSEEYLDVQDLNDLENAESSADLRILAQFTTSAGHQIRGEIVGVQDIFAIGLFVRGEVVLINKNMRTRSREQVAKFLALSGLAGDLTYDTLFPLTFVTKWGSQFFNDFSGVFDIRPSLPTFGTKRVQSTQAGNSQLK